MGEGSDIQRIYAVRAPSFFASNTNKRAKSYVRKYKQEHFLLGT